jgi:hypothetical protein
VVTKLPFSRALRLFFAVVPADPAQIAARAPPPVVTLTSSTSLVPSNMRNSEMF